MNEGEALIVEGRDWGEEVEGRDWGEEVEDEIIEFRVYIYAKILNLHEFAQYILNYIQKIVKF